jgi:hypothetical protein
MNRAAAKSWLKIYRVIDCIDVLFNPNAMALATRNSQPAASTVSGPAISAQP